MTRSQAVSSIAEVIGWMISLYFIAALLIVSAFFEMFWVAVGWAVVYTAAFFGIVTVAHFIMGTPLISVALVAVYFLSPPLLMMLLYCACIGEDALSTNRP